MKNNKYIRNGRYNASNGDFIYYEISSNTFCASYYPKDKKIEGYYGATSGGGDYYEIDKKYKKALLTIIDNYGFDTRKLIKFIRELESRKNR